MLKLSNRLYIRHWYFPQTPRQSGKYVNIFSVFLAESRGLGKPHMSFMILFFLIFLFKYSKFYIFNRSKKVRNKG